MVDTPLTLPTVGPYEGILFIGDPHVAASPPGYRLDDYAQSILAKLDFCLQTAREHQLLPIILGDLFHVPRNNPNHLLVALMDLFRPVIPWVLVGNHDKHEARLTPDVSLMVLHAARVIRLLAAAGPVATVVAGGRRVLVGASPDWTPIPRTVERGGHDYVIWVTHHDLTFPDYAAGRVHLRPIPGVDLVVNGHLHTPKPPVQRGETLWCNPGSISRVALSSQTPNKLPVAAIWRPGQTELETLPIPHRPFHEVFPAFVDREAPSPDDLDESRFIKGLENLMMRKTSEGLGLRAFLAANLQSGDPIDALIWELYEEVMREENQE